MTIEEKYKLAIKTLQCIANFDHIESCNSNAPVHECGCYEKDERELATYALLILGEL